MRDHLGIPQCDGSARASCPICERGGGAIASSIARTSAPCAARSSPTNARRPSRVGDRVAARHPTLGCSLFLLGFFLSPLSCRGRPRGASFLLFADKTGKNGPAVQGRAPKGRAPCRLCLAVFFPIRPASNPRPFFFCVCINGSVVSLSFFFVHGAGSARRAPRPRRWSWRKTKDKARGKNSIRLARACGFSVGRWRRRRPPSSGEPAAGTRPGSVSAFFLPTFSDDQRASSEGPPAAFRERALLL